MEQPGNDRNQRNVHKGQRPAGQQNNRQQHTGQHHTEQRHSGQPHNGQRISKKRQLQKQRKKQQVITAVCVTALVLLVLAILFVIVQAVRSGKAESETDPTLQTAEEKTTPEFEGETQETPEPQTDSQEESTENDLVNNTDQEITDLVKAYFSAKVKADEKQLKKYVDNLTDEVLKEMKNETAYIEGYSGITLSLKKGMTDNAHVVYAAYNTKFLNIETPAPSSAVLYVVKDPEKGSWYIHAWEPDGEIGQYISSLNQDEDVKAFNADVDKKLKAAREKDKTLDAFCKSLLGD